MKMSKIDRVARTVETLHGAQANFLQRVALLFVALTYHGQ